MFFFTYCSPSLTPYYFTTPTSDDQRAMVSRCVCATGAGDASGMLASLREEAELWKVKYQEQVEAFAAMPNGDGAHGEPPQPAS